VSSCTHGRGCVQSVGEAAHALKSPWNVTPGCVAGEQCLQPLWGHLGRAQMCQPLHLRAGMCAGIRSTFTAWQVAELPGKGSPLVSWSCAQDSMLERALCGMRFMPCCTVLFVTLR
jgi:hypothetical protein